MTFTPLSGVSHERLKSSNDYSEGPNAEVHLIWLLLNRPEEGPTIFSQIAPDMFPSPAFAKIYKQYYENEISIDNQDWETIRWVQDRGYHWLPPYSPVLKSRLLSEWRAFRVGKIFQDAYNDIRQGREYRDTLSEVNRVEEAFMKKQSNMSSLFEEITNDYAAGSLKGFRTGVQRIDEMTERFQKGHMWVVAAYTNFGKTTLSMQMARKAISDGARVDFISLEMTDKQLLKKLIWIEKQQDGINTDQAMSQLIDLPFVVTEGLHTVKEIESHIRTNPFNANVFIVDYVQLMRASGKLFEDATEAANTLQSCAIDKEVCIVALSQITKESAKTGVSFIMDTKNSGAIAESADVVVEIHRQKDNAPELEDCTLFIKKNRHGRMGKLPIIFDNQKGIFLFTAT